MQFYAVIICKYIYCTGVSQGISVFQLLMTCYSYLWHTVWKTLPVIGGKVRGATFL